MPTLETQAPPLTCAGLFLLPALPPSQWRMLSFYLYTRAATVALRLLQLRRHAGVHHFNTGYCFSHRRRARRGGDD
jgi:hypothetical protein